MSDNPTAHKALIAPLRAAMVDFEEGPVRGALAALLIPDAPVRLSEPIGEMAGPDDFYRKAYAPLLDAWPDLERRDTIVIAGTDEFGIEWVGCGGCYVGTFEGPWLSIPPTGRLVSMRFHEFFRMENGRVTEIQALWDIPEVMMQADAWPLAPSLGREWQVPGPMTQDGIVPGPYDEEKSRKSREVIVEMLTHMKRHPASPPEAMEMPRFWHPRMSWYGPAGIGTARGIKGFRHIHQIPFLNGMPDRGRYVDKVRFHFFGDGAYTGVTGWPNMIQTLTDDGWLGIAPPNKRITMRSLDFWRIENGLIRENWVLVDLIDMYRQVGVDVFGRLGEFNKMRSLSRVALPTDAAG